MIPILVDAFGYPVEYPLRTLSMREEIHRPCPPPHLTEGPLQDVGGPYLFPHLFGEGVVVQAVVKVLLQASYRPLFLYLLLFPPGLEPSDGFPLGGSVEDGLGFGHAGPEMYPSELNGHVPELVHYAALHLEEGINLLNGLDQARLAIGGNELEPPPQESPTLQIHQEGPPALIVLLIHQTEGEDLLGAIFLEAQGTKHHFVLHPYLPHLLGYAIEEEEGKVIAQRSGLIPPELLIQVGRGFGDGSMAYFLAKKFLSDASEPSGAYSLEEEPTDGSVHIPAPTLIFVEELEFHGTFCQSGNAKALQEPVAGNQVPQVMPSPVSLSCRAALIFPGLHLRGHFLLQEILQAPLQCVGDKPPDLLLDIGLGFLYTSCWSRFWRLHGCTSFLGYCFSLQKGYTLNSFSAIYLT